MNQDIFCLDIPNQFSNITISDNNELFNENNYDLSLNQKNQFSENIKDFSFNSIFGSSTNNIKNGARTESDKEKEIKLNIDIHNINNDINNNYCCINNNITNNFDNNNFITNNNFNNNICNCSFCKSSQYISFNDSINKIPNEENFLNTTYNYENNIFNFDEINNNKNLNLNNKDNKNDFLFNDNNNKINTTNNNINNNSDYEINLNNSNKDIDKENDKESNEKNNNICRDTNLNNNMSKIIINLSSKRKLKKIRRKDNKVNAIIQYGHPKKINYKTMKQKLNIHKKLDLECRTDTLLFIYSISNLKKIITKIISKKNIKDKIYFNRIQNIYKNSILSLQHREYAQDITGFKLL